MKNFYANATEVSLAAIHTSRTTLTMTSLGINRFFLKRSIKRLTSQPAPERIPLSSPDILGRNYFSIFLRQISINAEIGIFAINQNTVTAHRFPEGSAPILTDIPIEDIDPFNFSGTFYLRRYEYRYKSPIHFEIANFLRLPHLQSLLSDCKQWIYNQRSLATHDRFKVLHYLVEGTIDNPGRAFSIQMVMAELLNVRIIFHPKYASRHKYYQLIFESLKEEGLLTIVDFSYKITPKALTALQSFEEEKNRHILGVRVQILLAALTAVSAASAIAQAYFAYKPSGI